MEFGALIVTPSQVFVNGLPVVTPPEWTTDTLPSDDTDLDTSLVMSGATQSYEWEIAGEVATGIPDIIITLNGVTTNQQLVIVGRTTPNVNLIDNPTNFFITGGHGAGTRFTARGKLHQLFGQIRIDYDVSIDDGAGAWLEEWHATGTYFGAGPITAFGANSSVANGLLTGSTIRMKRIN